MHHLNATALLVLVAGALSCAPAALPTTADGHAQGRRTMEADNLPLLDSVPTWFYPVGKRGQAPTVVLQGIIDVHGRVEAESIQLVSTTDTSFTTAARFTFMSAFYQPARAQGTPVRALVQQPINYERASGRLCELTTPLTTRVPPTC